MSSGRMERSRMDLGQSVSVIEKTNPIASLRLEIWIPHQVRNDKVGWQVLED